MEAVRTNPRRWTPRSVVLLVLGVAFVGHNVFRRVGYDGTYQTQRKTHFVSAAGLPNESRTSVVNHPFATEALPHDISEGKESAGVPSDRSNAAVEVSPTRPKLILHIGPHKTGTSSIQCDLTFFNRLLDARTNFLYLGRQYGECQQIPATYSVDTRRIISCLDRHPREPCTAKKEWIHLENTLAVLGKEKRKNVIISDEAFSRLKVNHENVKFLCETLGRHHEVTVVIVYRHYFSWLLSQYNEHYKPLPNRQFYKQWPGEGGKLTKPFVDYYERELQQQSKPGNYEPAVAKGNYMLAASVRNMHPATYLKSMWANFSTRVAVINMHDDGDLTENFVRNALSSEALIAYESRSGHSPGRPNPSMELDFDILALRAHEKGLVPHSRKITRRVLALYLEATFGSAATSGMLPYICLNETSLQDLYRTSAQFERDVFPNDDNESLLVEHHTSFAKDVARRKFCNLDVDAILESDDVLSWFRQLAKQT